MFRVFQYLITAQENGQTVERYLRQKGYSRHILTHLKRTENGILCNGIWAYTSHQLHSGDLLEIRLLEDTSSENILPRNIPFSIIFEDEDILVINKPANTPIHPSQGNHENTLANGIAWYFSQQNQPFVYRCINRLDRDTTGLLILAKNMLSGAILSTMMRERKISRTYRAIVWGHPPASGTIDLPIGRKEGSTIERTIDPKHGDSAITHFRTLQTYDRYSLIELRLETGRTHQIRVHMTASGHPLLGDTLYNPQGEPLIHRQALHSWKLEFTHPITGKSLSFQANLPSDMQCLCS